MPGSILIMTYDTSTGRMLAQLAGSAQISDGAITSGKIASGIVGTVHLRDLAVTSAKIAANAIGGVHILDGSILGADLGDGIVTSAKIGANAIGGAHILDGSILGADLADAAVVSAKIGVGAVGGVLLQDSGVLSGKVAAGSIGGGVLWDFGIVSGKYASGSITDGALASGISIDIAEIVQEPSYRAEALISAYLGVQFSVSGYFNYAQAADAATMPAVGLATANILSGQIGTFQYQGRIANPAWDFSGYIGELLFLGTSSEVTRTAPSVSGRCVQRLAKVIGPTTVFLKPELAFVQLAE